MINFLKPDDIELYCTNEIISLDHFDKLLQSHYALCKDEFVYTHSYDHALLTLLTNLNIKQAVFYTPLEEHLFYFEKFYFDYVKKINRIEAIGQMVPKNSVVIFQNPSFPDGQWYELEELIQYWMEQNCTIIIDESYLPYTSKQSLKNYINKYDKFYVIFSLNGFFGSDKFNTTVLCSQKANLHYLQFNHNITPYEISYLYHSFNDRNFATISKAIHSKQRMQLELLLSNSNKVKQLFLSATNCITMIIQEQYLESFLALDESFQKVQDHYVVLFLQKSEQLQEILQKIKRWDNEKN